MSNRDTFLTLAELEADHIRAVFEHHDGNMSRAARTLGIDRRTMYRKAQGLGLRGTRDPHPAATRAELSARIQELEAKVGAGA